jgi:hypothetical protein
MGAGLSGKGVPDIAGEGRAGTFDASARLAIQIRDLHALGLLAERLSRG